MGVMMIKRFFLGAIDVWWVLVFQQESIKFDNPKYVGDQIFFLGNGLGIIAFPLVAYVIIMLVLLMWGLL
jgi:hypothetical protein